jgi:hypothetical protein
MRLKEEGAAQVKASTDRLNKSFASATTGANKLDGGISALSSGMVKLGGALGVGLAFRKLIVATSEAQYAQAQLQSALKSTGYAAGQSITALNDHAVALQRMTAFGDDAVSGAQALLLTFTKVRGDVFPKATTAVLDMAQAMGTDLKSAALQVGKALNDPVLGVGALARAGVQFSEQQKAMIKSLVETGQVAKAQAIILQELETQFGGSAEAARKTLGGALAALKESFGDLFEVSDTGTKDVVTGINSIINVLTSLKSWMDRNNVFGVLVREVGLLAQAIGDTIKWFQMLGQQSDATGKLIDGMAEVMRGVNNFSKETIANGRAMMSAAKAEYSAIQQRMGALITESKDRETATRAMSDYKGVLDGVLGSITSDYNARGKQAEALNAVTAATIKLTEVSELGVPYFERLPLAMMPFDPIAALQGGAPRDDPSKGAALEKEKELEFRLNIEKRRNFMIAETTQMANDVRDSLANTLGDALATGIQAAFAKGANFGDAMKAFGVALLGGIGNLMVALGQRLVQLGSMMKFAMESFAKNNPGGMIVAGLAMIAVGAALRGAASRAMNQTGFGGGGGGGGGYSAAATGGNMTMPTAYYGPTSAGSANTIERINPISVTIIGPNDPTAQRQMQELLRNAQRRGNV